MSIFREPSSIYTSEMPSAWQPSPDILKDFARLQAEVTALGESNVALVNDLMEAKCERDEARRSSDAAHKRIHDLSIENDNLKFELAKAVQALQNYKKNG